MYVNRFNIVTATICAGNWSEASDCGERSIMLHGDNLTVMVDVLDFFLSRNSKELI